MKQWNHPVHRWIILINSKLLSIRLPENIVIVLQKQGRKTNIEKKRKEERGRGITAVGKPPEESTKSASDLPAQLRRAAVQHPRRSPDCSPATCWSFAGPAPPGAATGG